MPWEERSRMSLRQEFVNLVGNGELSVTETCRRFSISRKTGYKWLKRYAEEGALGLADRSRRPHHIAFQIPRRIEDEIVSWRNKHPTWGARKIRRKLQDAETSLVLATSTITAVLHRHDLIGEESPGGRQDWQRFEHPYPNGLWQMDFKGPIPTLAGICHPLTILDDHSRFNLCIKALPDEKRPSVKRTLEEVFHRYGLPDRFLVDNGGPWRKAEDTPYTKLSVWLIRVGVGISHSSPYHPQTLGKDERFHRTLKTELIESRQWRDIADLQQGFDSFREEYNFERPHDSLSLDVPASRYRVSLRSFPATLPPIEYESGVEVRKVQQKGEFSFKGRFFHVSRAFAGYPVGIRPTSVYEIFDVLFCQETISRIDLRDAA